MFNSSNHLLDINLPHLGRKSHFPVRLAFEFTITKTNAWKRRFILIKRCIHTTVHLYIVLSRFKLVTKINRTSTVLILSKIAILYHMIVIDSFLFRSPQTGLSAYISLISCLTMYPSKQKIVSRNKPIIANGKIYHSSSNFITNSLSYKSY